MPKLASLFHQLYMGRMAVATLKKEYQTPPKPRFMTEEEFEAWCDEDTKAEFVDGEVIIMSPASTAHNAGESTLGALIDLFVKRNKLGFVSSTGMAQVRLRQGLRRDPDIVFVQTSRLANIRETYIDGAPDLVVEFVSPDSVIRDWHEKYIEYESAGVREYWIIDQKQKRIAAFILGEDHRYQLLELEDGKLCSRVLPGFWIKPEWFWQELILDTFEMAKAIGIVS
ncbi:MAG: Uma2 family endonuclease [bacterium]